MYRHQLEVSTISFQGHRDVWLTGTADVMGRLRTYPFMARVKVRGRLSKPGRYGHLNRRRYELYVCELVDPTDEATTDRAQ